MWTAGLVSFELVNGYVICHALQIAIALILAIFLSTFVRCLTFISIFCGMCTGK